LNTRLPEVVFDLDGTLSDGKHRLHLLPKKEDAGRTEAWDEFNMAAGADAPIIDNIRLLHLMQMTGHKVVILTGRCSVASTITRDWLAQYNIPYYALIMRPEGDQRKDVDFKEEKLKELGLDNILCCFDDLEHVAKHIRSLGVTCHLVTHYDTPKLHETQVQGTTATVVITGDIKE